jgi:hypothetical protein
MATIVITGSDVEERYASLTSCLTVEAELVTEMIGGQPGTEEGVKSFVKHHLKLEGAEAEKVVRNILSREVGQRKEITPPEGEIKEEVESYAVNVIRRTEFGPYIGDWMLKAMFKQAASRIGLFKKKIGTKGDFAEGGRVNAVGNSLIDDPRKIYLYSTDIDAYDETGGHPLLKTNYRKFRGKVSTPAGALSIVHDSETAPVGTRFSFEYRFMEGKTSKEDALSILAVACNCGVGSAKAFECGKLKVINATFSTQD